MGRLQQNLAWITPGNRTKASWKKMNCHGVRWRKIKLWQQKWRKAAIFARQSELRKPSRMSTLYSSRKLWNLSGLCQSNQGIDYWSIASRELKAKKAKRKKNERANEKCKLGSRNVPMKALLDLEWGHVTASGLVHAHMKSSTCTHSSARAHAFAEKIAPAPDRILHYSNLMIRWWRLCTRKNTYHWASYRSDYAWSNQIV